MIVDPSSRFVQQRQHDRSHPQSLWPDPPRSARTSLDFYLGGPVASCYGG